MIKEKIGILKKIQGIGASPGIAVGPAFVWDPRKPLVTKRPVRDEDIEREKARFREAVERAEEEITEILQDLPDELQAYGDVFQFHRLMLRDRMIHEQTVALIAQEKVCAEWALACALDRARELFRNIKDHYIRERIEDVEFAVERVIRILEGNGNEDPFTPEEPVIIVASDLSPEDTIRMKANKILAIATDKGSRTSHTAILARSIGIPAVVGLEHVSSAVESGQTLVVDGICGVVHIAPDEHFLEVSRAKQARFNRRQLHIIHSSHLPAETEDGHRIKIKANIELIDEIPAVIANGAEGVGLLRTEYLYLAHKELPSEDLLFQTYREVAEKIAPYPVTIRTLDIGGDKFTSHVHLAPEINPALGLRAIRLSLKEPELFRSQLRAILRASAFGEVRVLLPLVSGVQEIRTAKAHIEEIRNGFMRDGVPFDSDIKVGVMIEVPSAVLIADHLAREADFFSIGTNDLIQYTLAIDRVNEHVAHLYNPLHPAVIRMLHQTVDAAHGAGIEISVCGEMAGEPLYVPLFVGLGVDELSMNPQAVPEIKRLIRRCRQDQCASCVRDLLGAPSSKDILEILGACISNHLQGEEDLTSWCSLS